MHILGETEKKGARLKLDDFDPCIVLINNDLSAGIPFILYDLEQRIFPPLQAGWAIRSKSEYFNFYTSVASKFAELLNIDPWLITPLSLHCGPLNFQTSEGFENLVEQVDSVFSITKKKYATYGIEDAPFVIVKADRGTYGMGVMTVRSTKELLQMGRRVRNKMGTIKDSQTVSEVVVQEGVHTSERVQQAVAEPVIYLLDGSVVGGFYRTHEKRGIDENLNIAGAKFFPLPFDFLQTSSDISKILDIDGDGNRFYIYGVMARLASLAASYEMEATENKLKQPGVLCG
jgi:glutamate--cysteine ligase